MPRLSLFLAILIALLAGPALGNDQKTLERAWRDAIDSFETALPALGGNAWDVEVSAYRDALTLQRFTARHWGQKVQLATEIRAKATGSCGRYAAFVRLPPEQGKLTMVFCPQFFLPGADDLRSLTILHEMVHVVAGSNECRAMAFAASIEAAAKGRHTPVEAYWRANGCEQSGFRLPD